MTRRPWLSLASTATAWGTEFCKCRLKPTKHTRPEAPPTRVRGASVAFCTSQNQCYEETASLASNNVILFFKFFFPVSCFPTCSRRPPDLFSLVRLRVVCFRFVFFLFFLGFFSVLASRVGVFFQFCLQWLAGNFFA